MPTSRRHLGTAILGSVAGLSFPHNHGAHAANTLWPSEPPHDWMVTGTQFLSLGFLVYQQDSATDKWQILRPPAAGGDPSQAPPSGLLPNDLDVPPSPLNAHANATADRLLETARRNASRRGPAVTNIGSDKASIRLSMQELENHRLSIVIVFFLRDLSNDVRSAANSSDAMTVLMEVTRYTRGLSPGSSVYVGPRMTVHTVQRSSASDWLLRRIDDAVERALGPFL